MTEAHGGVGTSSRWLALRLQSPGSACRLAAPAPASRQPAQQVTHRPPGWQSRGLRGWSSSCLRDEGVGWWRVGCVERRGAPSVWTRRFWPISHSTAACTRGSFRKGLQPACVARAARPLGGARLSTPGARAARRGVAGTRWRRAGHAAAGAERWQRWEPTQGVCYGAGGGARREEEHPPASKREQKLWRQLPLLTGRPLIF